MPKKQDEDAPYWVQMREAERSIIGFALEHGGSARGTANILGVSANYLRERCRELGIATPEVKPGPKPGTKPPARPAQPDLRAVPPSPGSPRPSLPPGEPLVLAGNEDENEDEPDEDGSEDEDDLDEDEEGDEDDDEEEDDAEDDTATDGKAQSSN